MNIFKRYQTGWEDGYKAGLKDARESREAVDLATARIQNERTHLYKQCDDFNKEKLQWEETKAQYALKILKEFKGV